MDYAARRERLLAAMENAGLDAVVFGIGASLRYFTGLDVDWVREAEPEEPTVILALRRDGLARILCLGDAPEEPATDLALETLESAADLPGALGKMLPPGTVGLGRPARDYLEALVREAQPRVRSLDGEGPAESLRIIKEPAEIDILRRAAARTDAVMGAVLPGVRPGVTQSELVETIRSEGLSRGATAVSFPPTAGFVRSGSEPTPEPLVHPDDVGLSPGSSIAFDFGFVWEGYCSDFGRSLYLGPAADHIAEAYRALSSAQVGLIEALGPGRLRLDEMFGHLEALLDEAGYGDRLRARLPDGTLGHQIGVDLHENPWIRPGAPVDLVPGMVMCIEPKLWHPGEYYLRVEDMVLITEDGAEPLTRFDRALFEIPVS